MFLDEAKREPNASAYDELTSLQDNLIKKIPRFKDLTKKKNLGELYPFHVISHEQTNQEESLLAKIKRNQEHRRRLFEIHQKI